MKIKSCTMAKKCYVTTCSNTYKKTKNLCVIDEKNCTLTVITYHSFPNHPYLKMRWIKATGRLNWEPTSSSFICSEHFRESDYETIKENSPENDDGPTQLKRVLKKTAVPSLQLGGISRSEELAINSSEKKLDDLSDGSETSDSSSIDNGNILIRGDTADLSIVKEEPCSPNVEESEQQEEPHFIITSAITVKEENDHSDKPNGILESENDCFSRNHLEYSYESSPDHLRSKRLKHDDTLIAPEDIKVETCSTSFTFNFDCNLSIEVKYERLLDEFLKLKRDYDLLKFKFEKQSEAISKCEHILSECR